jgi:hypothetical protein
MEGREQNPTGLYHITGVAKFSSPKDLSTMTSIFSNGAIKVGEGTFMDLDSCWGYSEY